MRRIRTCLRVVAVCVCFFTAASMAQQPPAVAPEPVTTPAPETKAKVSAPCPCTEPPKAQAPIVEFSFGTSQLFNRGPGASVAGSRILPTSAVLLLGEWLFHEAFSLSAFLNIPLSTAVVVVDGVPVVAIPDSVAALGLRWSPLRLDFREKSIHLELQTTALLGRTLSLTANDTFLPVVAGRLHLSNPSGFAMYLGVSWAFVRESLALIYGIGYRF